jgi:oxygen-independent coproporphyrinogen III oxidase
MHIYVHLPFCLSKCIYCDFVVDAGANAASPDKRQAYLAALTTEITHYLNHADALSPIKTLYFGGGTPGLFSATEIASIITTITTFAPLAPDAELTLEINPEYQASSLSAYRASGINRSAVMAGFDNLSIDLMYGIPEQTLASWHETLAQAVALPVQHVSTYGLQVEHGTPLATLVSSQRFSVADEDLNADMYEAAVDALAQAGFQRYEISNFSKPGFESRHNLNTWRQGHYWAFGVGAHGFVNRCRYEHSESLAEYLADPTEWPVQHTVDDAEHAENKLIFGLRLADGLDFSAATWTETDQLWGTTHGLHEKIEKLVAEGWLRQHGSRIALAPHAVAVSNSVLNALL